MNAIIEEDLSKIISSDIKWGYLKDKTVLVTGANGILASYIIETLLYLNKKKENRTKVLALVRNIEHAKKKFAEHLDDELFQFLVQDVIDEVSYKYKIDYIIHAASQASPKYYGIDPVGTLNANVLGTHNMLQLAKKNDVYSFLYFSSGEIYGEMASELFPIVETSYGYLDPVKVRSCYAESKRMGENMCVSWLFQYGVRTKIIRPFHTYGPGMKLDDGRVFADFVKNILENSNVILRSDGLAKRAFCYISDAIIGYFKVLLEGNDGEAYNVGNPDCEISILDLANILVDLYPEKKLKVISEIIENDVISVKMRSPLLRNTPNVDKLIALGWKPSISIEEGFRRTINSYII